MVEQTPELIDRLYQASAELLAGYGSGDFTSSRAGIPGIEHLSLATIINPTDEQIKFIAIDRQDRGLVFTVDPTTPLVRRKEKNARPPKAPGIFDRLRGKQVAPPRDTANPEEIQELIEMVSQGQPTYNEKQRRELDRRAKFQADRVKQQEAAIQEKAQEIYAQLTERRKPRGLVMVVDDSVNKVMQLMDWDIKPHMKHNPDLGYVVSTHYRGREAAAVYRAIRTLEGNSHNTIVMIMDGVLEAEGQNHLTGIGVAQEVAAASETNGWPEPFFVGFSSEDRLNEQLQEQFSGLYLGTIDPNSAEVKPEIFTAIESTFK